MKNTNISLENRFGLVYETKEGKKYLFKSYKTEESLVKDMNTNKDFLDIEKENVFIYRLDDKDIEVNKKEEVDK